MKNKDFDGFYLAFNNFFSSTFPNIFRVDIWIYSGIYYMLAFFAKRNFLKKSV